jgi:hypothetical protein
LINRILIYSFLINISLESVHDWTECVPIRIIDVVGSAHTDTWHECKANAPL